MIGVVADLAEQDVVREFFQLFKTPWEFYHAGRLYDVVVCSGDRKVEEGARFVVSYASDKELPDHDQQVRIGGQRKHVCVVSHQGKRIPIYCGTLMFPEAEGALLMEEGSLQCVGYLTESKEFVQARIGYDLFSEVRMLLTVGQPAANAAIPALDLHIALLRDLITNCGISLVEIPPVPDGYRFMACLTHDVDHPSIRRHKWDHTTFGFLRRAVFGSLKNLIQGRISVEDLLANWTAAVKLPFVHLGLAKDFWQDFDDTYLKLENGVRSTFFVIPFKNRSGKTSDGQAPRFRAARYGARDIASSLRKLLEAGCEVGLHGIDAWVDDSCGLEELEEIRRLTGATEIGARMHWLYYDEKSPSALEKAGAAYDSTVGYNETVGYRAGTTQVYKPLDANRLLELPLHVMDTALFYPAYLGLSQKEAKNLLNQIADNAAQLGGCMTINWHDRSVAPERLWGSSYGELVQDLKNRDAWFATAGQAISWFRMRRAVIFETDGCESDEIRTRVAADDSYNDLPGLRLRIHKARESARAPSWGSDEYVDLPLSESADYRIPTAAC